MWADWLAFLLCIHVLNFRFEHFLSGIPVPVLLYGDKVWGLYFSKFEYKNITGLLEPNSFNSGDSRGVVGGSKEKLPIYIKNEFLFKLF